MDDLTPTDVTGGDASTASLVPTGAGAVTPGGDDGAAQLAQAALDQASGQPAATTDPIEQALSAIPADDNDLSTIVDQTQLQRVQQMRGQLRVLGEAVRELQPLRQFQQYGDPKALESRLRIHQLLYTPVLGPDKKPIRDPQTQTIRITTKPFVDYLDKTNPGLPEQLLVDLLDLETEDGRGVKRPLLDQVFEYYKLDINRLPQYQNIDTLITRTSGAVTPEELAEIPSEYHAAYRTIPPSIRAAWAGYDEADRTRMLEDYKGKLDDVAFKEQQRTESARREAAENARYAQYVATEQVKYLDTVRRERTSTLIQSLSQQVKFSTDENVNKVMIGSLAASVAQLFDPDWRFVTVENVLEPLGLKLDHTFDAALAKFDESARESVALELAGNTERAVDVRDDAFRAANQLAAKIATFALKIAKAQGATVVERAAVQAGNLAAAVTARPGPGNGQVGVNGRLLPDGVRPGSDEAARSLAYSTGLFKEAS